MADDELRLVHVVQKEYQHASQNVCSPDFGAHISLSAVEPPTCKLPTVDHYAAHRRIKSGQHAYRVFHL